MKTYLTPAGAGRILGLTPSAVRAMTDRGELTAAAMTESGIRLYRKADVEAVASRREARKELHADG